MRLFLLFSFLLLSSFAFSQIETVEDFESSTFTPDGWTANGFWIYPGPETCNQTNTASIYMSPWAPEAEVLTPYLSGASNATDLTINFDLKVAIFSFWDGETPVEPGWGTIDVSYTTNGTDWILIETIDDSNFTSTLTCDTRSYNISADDLPEGSDFQFRIQIHHLEGEYNVYLDNFSITQVATSIPNCNAALSEPANGATGIELNTSINWTNSTGLASGYRITIGTTPGGTEVADNVDMGDANTYTPPAQLEYSTVYYVTILSYNDFGDAIDCMEQSFTTRNPPPPGASCGNPLVISEFPYMHSNNVEGFDNDYSSGPCENSWIIAGDEVVYEITPEEQISINVRFDSLVGNQPAIQVIDGCPDIAQNCLASWGSWTPESQYFENLILDANHTYYIVVSSIGTDNYFDYYLEVTQNPCVIPDAVVTGAEDCDNNQYYAEVDITRMGTAESLTIVDDQGSDAQQATGLGILTFGPYPTGTVVNFTITNDQDDYCTITRTSEFHCNDFCANAYPVEVNDGETCESVTHGSLIAATATVENFSICENLLLKDVWFTFVATKEVHTIQILNVEAVIGQWASVYYEVLEGECGDLSSLLCSNYNYNIVGGLTVGNTYYIRVYDGSTDTAAEFDVCVTTPPDSPVNDLCSNATELPVSSSDGCEMAVTGTTISALTSPENNCWGFSNDVWYAFTPENTGYYRFDLAVVSGFAYTTMSFWEGECGNLTQASDCGESQTMVNYAVAGETSYVMVRSSQGEVGVEFTLCAHRIFPPAHNSCETPVVFMESDDENGNNIVIDNNEGASNTYGTCYSNFYVDLWYEFTPKYTGEYIFNFEVLGFNFLYFAIFEDNCDEFILAPGLFQCYNQEPTVINVVAGNTYKVAIHGPDPDIYEFFVYPVNLPPANDNCSSPETLLESTEGQCENMITGNTYSASNTSANDCIDGDYEVWYNFTPENSGIYRFDLTQTAGASTMGMVLFSGDCGTLVQESVQCYADSMIISLEGGITYSLAVTSSSEGGTAPGVEFNLCTYEVTGPENNDCPDAIIFEESADETGGNTVSGTNENATYSAEACYETSYTGVWYTFTPVYSGQYTIEFTSLTGTPSYTIYEGSCGDLSILTDCYQTEAATFEVVAGNSYMVSIHAEEVSSFEFFVYPDEIIGTEDLTETVGLKYFPNPVSGDRLNLSADENISTVAVFNTLGQKVISATPEAANHSINLSQMESGIYFVEVTINGAMQTFKIIKQ